MTNDNTTSDHLKTHTLYKHYITRSLGLGERELILSVPRAVAHDEDPRDLLGGGGGPRPPDS